MERVDRILRHEAFRFHLRQNEEAERERRFCKHGIEHFLDVARIAAIMNLEEELSIEKEIIYATALLHDIGKHVQYEDGTPHELAGAELAPSILQDCGFHAEEVEQIVDAILVHRKSEVREEPNLRGLLYRADKASRACFACKAQKDCNWKDGKKNFREVM